METLVLHPQNKEQLSAVKAFAKALKIEFETKKSTYGPEFVKKILQGSEDVRNGKGIKVDVANLWK